VFLPAVRPLLALAAELESERNHVIPPPAAASDDLDALDLAAAERERESQEFEALESEAAFAHVLHGGRAVTAEGGAAPAGAGLAPEDEEFLGLPGLLSPEQTAQLLARRDVELRRRAVAAVSDDEPSAAELAAYEQVASLRRRLSAMVSAYAAATGRPHAQIHAELRRRTGGPPTAQAGVDLLEARIAALAHM
jgi:hypothetical protein